MSDDVITYEKCTKIIGTLEPLDLMPTFCNVQKMINSLIDSAKTNYISPIELKWPCMHDNETHALWHDRVDSMG